MRGLWGWLHEKPHTDLYCNGTQAEAYINNKALDAMRELVGRMGAAVATFGDHAFEDIRIKLLSMTKAPNAEVHNRHHVTKTTHTHTTHLRFHHVCELQTVPGSHPAELQPHD